MKKALEKKQLQLVELQGKLQDQNFMLKDMHKMKLLGDVSESTYEAEAEKVQKLQKQVQELQKEINLIETYKTEDVKAVIEELDAERIKVSKKYRGKLEKLQMELLEAKLNYLKKQVEVKERYAELVEPERKLDSLKIGLGIKKNSYIGDAFETLNMVSVGAGYIPLRVELNEISDTLRYGRIPEQLEKVVKEAKEKGILE